MKVLIVLFIVLVSCYSQDLNALPGVPQSLIKKANQALKKSVPQLQKFSSGRFCRLSLYHAVNEAVQQLNKIQDILDKNNVVVGNNNAIKGDGNVIIGNQNAIDGDDNWLISINKYQTKSDKTLVFKKWEIKMDQVKNIPANPYSVIKTLNGVKKNEYNRYFQQHNRNHTCGFNLFCCNQFKNNKCNQASSHSGCRQKSCNNERSSRRRPGLFGFRH